MEEEQTRIKPWKEDMDAVLERLDCLQKQVDQLSNETKDMVSAFNAAQGAFIALEWIARTVKPIIIIITTIGAFTLWLKGVKL